ncbi:hypothetical protein BVC80_1139g3 [Macleaya cordata]|uniref:RNase H type-1 domain-containing protein n=1 Tax=Macleaya cordata TaxID=56857 RepID=A0A200Q2S0_MACCD|nr:hypothetical protein BVC80_1139g3 [Macleaya cordata]
MERNNLPGEQGNQAHRKIVTDKSIIWLPPLINVFKVNFDASFSSSHELVGMGFIWGDHTWNFEGAGCSCSLVLTVKAAESRATLSTIRWAKEKNYNRIILKGGKKQVVDYIRRSGGLKVWRSRNYLEEVVSISKSFEYFSCNHVKRTGNNATDALSKYGRKNVCNDSWMERPPFFLNDVVISDTVSLVGP